MTKKEWFAIQWVSKARNTVDEDVVTLDIQPTGVFAEYQNGLFIWSNMI